MNGPEERKGKYLRKKAYCRQMTVKKREPNKPKQPLLSAQML
jgi:hypothetical protein